MHEIEVKARVPDRDKLRRQLIETGCTFSEVITQDDTVYSNLPKIPGTAQPDRLVLRIRIEAGRSLFTLKKDRSNELSGEEHELEISDPEEMRQIIALLGFKEIVRIRKERQTGTWKDCTLCLDRVEGLGDFIELERLTDQENDLEIQEELTSLLKTLGVEADQKVTKGYDSLLIAKAAGEPI